MYRSVSFFPSLARGCIPAYRADETSEGELSTLTPYAFVDEDKDSYTIDLDLPGLAREEIKIETEDGELSISGERKGRYRVKKLFSLPDDVDAEAIEAKHENGVLKLRLPKTAKVNKAREIPIK